MEKVCRAAEKLLMCRSFLCVKSFLCKRTCVSSFCVQKLFCAKAFCAQRFLCTRDFSLTREAFWRAEELRWVEKSFERMRNFERLSGAQSWDEMKIVEKNLDQTWEKMRWDEKSWNEVRRAQIRWDEMKCGLWSVSAKCEVWSVQCEECSCEVWNFKCDLWNSTSLSHKARTHGPGWRTVHASSIDEKGLIV